MPPFPSHFGYSEKPLIKSEKPLIHIKSVLKKNAMEKDLI